MRFNNWTNFKDLNKLHFAFEQDVQNRYITIKKKVEMLIK